MTLTTSAKRAQSSSRRKLKKPADELLFLTDPSVYLPHPALPPVRLHSETYHKPLLSTASSNALLDWFERVATNRSMPWRKEWIDPNDSAGDDKLRAVLAQRAYEVWVSETMLQQTRVSTVIPYFNTWMAKWPTIQALAEAPAEDVLSVWAGLGYYSRATRLHKAAQTIVADASLNGMLPDTPEELKDKVQGVGPYTAGAIASIVFGRAVPVVDGNVARVLSRQIGLYADSADKRVLDMLWKVAGVLVKQAASLDCDDTRSEVPGKWNQALMELGSTICTPKPQCQLCPIQSSCKAFAEGQAIVAPTTLDDVGAIKSESEPPGVDSKACSFCADFHDVYQEFRLQEPALVDMEDSFGPETSRGSKKRRLALSAEVGKDCAKKMMIRNFTLEQTVNRRTKRPSPQIPIASRRRTRQTSSACAASKPLSDDDDNGLTPDTNIQLISAYCSLFPKKAIKKKVPEEDCVVCLIRWRSKNDDGEKWLIEQRPDKGLLASLWEFPTVSLGSERSTASQRQTASKRFVSSLEHLPPGSTKPKYMGEIGTVTHIFSHLKLHMHIHLFLLQSKSGEEAKAREDAGIPRRVWTTAPEVGKASMGTGMKKCWMLYNKREDA